LNCGGFFLPGFVIPFKSAVIVLATNRICKLRSTEFFIFIFFDIIIIIIIIIFISYRLIVVITVVFRFVIFFANIKVDFVGLTGTVLF
jgi:hypothetical protein